MASGLNTAQRVNRIRFWKHSLLTFLLAAFLAPACSIPKKTAVMANIDGVDITAEQLRLKVADFVMVFGGMVERSADEIIENSGSSTVRWNALQWKSNALPASQAAAFQFDPLVGLFDLWAFSKQQLEFFETGKGKHLFGDKQFIAVRTARNFDDELTRFVESMGQSYDLEKAKATITAWVEKNPLDNILLTRRSSNTSLGAYSKDKSLGQVLGGMDERMTDMTTRMNVIMQQMPKIGRWQGQLFIADQVRRPVVEMFNTRQMTKDLQPAMDSFKKIADLAPQMPQILEQQRAAIKGDIQELSRQILGDIQIRTEQTIKDTSVKTQYLVDYIFIRMVALLGILGLILFVFALLLRRRPARA